MRLSPRRHSSESWNPGNGAGGGSDCWILQTPNRAACPWRSYPLCENGLLKPLDSDLCRNDNEKQKSLAAIPMARLPQSFVNDSGSALLDPACAGMTAGWIQAPPKRARLSPLPVNTTSKSNAMRLSPRRHSSESWNPGNGAGGGSDCWILQTPNRAACPWRSYPLCENGLLKPLDSDLCRNDNEKQKSLAAIPMARLPQSFVNDSGSALLDPACAGMTAWWIQAPPKRARLSPLPVNATSKSNAMRLCPRRHSSESWNPGNGTGGAVTADFTDAESRGLPVAVIPAMREWIIKTTGFRSLPE